MLSTPPTPPQPKPIEIFFSYAHEDEALLERLLKHLSSLKDENLISGWYDREISGGTEWEPEILKHLNSAGIILLLVSPDFMASDYINSTELKRAMERHQAKEARVIPIILQPVDWQRAPFGKLQAFPTHGKAVTTWSNRNRAFLNIVTGIRKVIEELNANP